MDKAAAGRLGGVERMRRHGIWQCPACGAIHHSDVLSDIARQGGIKVREVYGREYFSELGKRGGRGNKRQR